MIAPAARRLAMAGASLGAMLSSRILEWQVVATPAISILSFTPSGMPCNGPSDRPATMSVSALRAVSSAPSASTRMKAPQSGLSTSGVVPPPGIPANTFFEHKITNLFTVGPRLGYAWDRWMIFATGGYASADLKTAACSQVTGLCNQGNLARFNGQSRNSGWYAGGGFDYMVHKGPLVDVLLGLEYQHFDVGSKNAFCFNGGCNPGTGWDEDLSAKGDLVRARLTIKTSGYSFLYR